MLEMLHCEDAGWRVHFAVVTMMYAGAVTVQADGKDTASV
jgi:hypothetical protein